MKRLRAKLRNKNTDEVEIVLLLSAAVPLPTHYTFTSTRSRHFNKKQMTDVSTIAKFNELCMHGYNEQMLLIFRT